MVIKTMKVGVQLSHGRVLALRVLKDLMDAWAWTGIKKKGGLRIGKTGN
jgi:hypothetical protein